MQDGDHEADQCSTCSEGSPVIQARCGCGVLHGVTLVKGTEDPDVSDEGSYPRHHQHVVTTRHVDVVEVHAATYQSLQEQFVRVSDLKRRSEEDLVRCSNESQRFKAEASLYQRQLVDKEDEIAAFRTKVEREEAASKARAASQRESLERAVRCLQEELHAEQLESDRVREDLRRERELGNEAKGDRDAQQRALGQCVAELEVLRRDGDAIPWLQARVAELELAAATKEEECGVMRREFAIAHQEHDQETGSLQEAIRAMERELCSRSTMEADLRRQLAQSQADLQVAREDIRGDVEKLEKSMAQERRLKADADRDAENRVEEVERQLREAQERNTRFEGVERELMELKEQTRLNREAQQDAEAIASRLQKEFGEVNHDKVILEGQHSETLSLLQTLREEHVELQARATKWETEYRDATHSLGGENTRLEAALAAATERTSHLETTIEQLSADLQVATEHLQLATVRVTRGEADLRTMQERAQHSSIDLAADIQGLTQRIRQAEEGNIALQEELRLSNEKNITLEASAQEQLSRLNAISSQRLTEVQSTVLEVEKLRQALRVEEQRREATEASLIHHREEVVRIKEEYRLEIQRLRSLLEVQQGLRASAESDLAQERQRVTTVREDLTLISQTKEEHTTQLEERCAQVDALLQDKQDALEAERRYLVDVERYTAEIQLLRLEVQDKVLCCTRSEEETMKLRLQLEQLQSKSDVQKEVQARMDTMVHQFNEIQTQLQGVMMERDRLLNQEKANAVLLTDRQRLVMEMEGLRQQMVLQQQTLQRGSEQDTSLLESQIASLQRQKIDLQNEVNSARREQTEEVNDLKGRLLTVMGEKQQLSTLSKKRKAALEQLDRHIKTLRESLDKEMQTRNLAEARLRLSEEELHRVRRHSESLKSDSSTALVEGSTTTAMHGGHARHRRVVREERTRVETREVRAETRASSATGRTRRPTSRGAGSARLRRSSSRNEESSHHHSVESPPSPLCDRFQRHHCPSPSLSQGSSSTSSARTPTPRLSPPL